MNQGQNINIKKTSKVSLLNINLKYLILDYLPFVECMNTIYGISKNFREIIFKKPEVKLLSENIVHYITYISFESCIAQSMKKDFLKKWTQDNSENNIFIEHRINEIFAYFILKKLKNIKIINLFFYYDNVNGIENKVLMQNVLTPKFDEIAHLNYIVILSYIDLVIFRFFIQKTHAKINLYIEPNKGDIEKIISSSYYYFDKNPLLENFKAIVNSEIQLPSNTAENNEIIRNPFLTNQSIYQQGLFYNNNTNNINLVFSNSNNTNQILNYKSFEYFYKSIRKIKTNIAIQVNCKRFLQNQLRLNSAPMLYFQTLFNTIKDIPSLKILQIGNNFHNNINREAIPHNNNNTRNNLFNSNIINSNINNNNDSESMVLLSIKSIYFTVISNVIINNECILELYINNQEIGKAAEELKILTDALVVNKTIRKLSLSDNLIGRNSEDIERLCLLIRNNSTIENLDLSKNELGFDHKIITTDSSTGQSLGKNFYYIIDRSRKSDIINLFEALENNKIIKTLNLSYNKNIGIINSKSFFNYQKFAKGINLKELYLEDIEGINDFFFPLIEIILSQNKELNLLSFQNISSIITEDFLYDFLINIFEDQTLALKKLNLRASNLTSDFVRFENVCQVLRNNNWLEYLDLSYNRLGIKIDFLKTFCDLICQNKSLKILNLSNNNIEYSQENSLSIAHVIKTNSSLEYFYFLDKENKQNLSHTLTLNNNTRNLIENYCDLVKRKIKNISQILLAMEQNRSLKYFELENYEIGENKEAMNSLIKFIKIHPTLESLFLTGININENSIDAYNLFNAIKTSSSLNNVVITDGIYVTQEFEMENIQQIFNDSSWTLDTSKIKAFKALKYKGNLHFERCFYKKFNLKIKNN